MFALSAVIVPDGECANLDVRWQGWKAQALGQHDAPIHEPMIRNRLGAPGWFRQQLTPGIVFQGKQDNRTGLQLADLVARPVADKVCDPASTPPRWPEVRTKLCPGKETKHSILGLKILPRRDEYEDLWKS